MLLKNWLPQCRLLHTALRSSSGSSNTAAKKRLGIVGVPFAKGQPKPGVENAPDLLRAQGLTQALEQISNGDLIVRDYGNLTYAPDTCQKPDAFGDIKNFVEFIGCNRALIHKVQEILRENDQFLTIGGDHAIGFGSVAGHLLHSPNLSLVWVDAHADINLHSTSGSGNIHGMPVSLLLQELRIYWENANLDKIAPHSLNTDQLVYIGLRDVDPYEAYILKKLGIRNYAMDDVDRLGIRKVIEMALDGLKPTNKIHLSFDVDALDRIWAPSTGTIVNGGLTLREGIAVAEALHDTNRLQGIDIVEINPSIGSADDVRTTLTSSMDVLKAAFGYRRGGCYENRIDTSRFETSVN